MKKRILSILTASAMLSSLSVGTTAFLVDAADTISVAEDALRIDPIIGELPDWAPCSFVEAVNFYNTYGKTHVDDNVICVVRPVILYRLDDYGMFISGSMTMVNTPACSSPKVYELEIPEKPDPDDMAAVNAYREYCRQLGLSSYDYEFFESYQYCKTQVGLEVTFFQVLEGTDLTVCLTDNEYEENNVTDEFSFENTDGKVTETDIYGWLPDSVPEFKEFEKENGKLSVHDDNIVFCNDSNPSTGYSWVISQTGDSAVEKILSSDCRKFYSDTVEGAVSYSAEVYKPKNDGTVAITCEYCRPWRSPEMDPAEKTIVNIYNVKDSKISKVNDSDITINITLIDSKTGELIAVSESENFMPLNSSLAYHNDELFSNDNGWFFIDKNYCITANPYSFKTASSFDMDVSSFICSGGYIDNVYYSVDPEKTVITNSEDSIDIIMAFDRHDVKPYDYTELPELEKGVARVAFVDSDTGMLLEYPQDDKRIGLSTFVQYRVPDYTGEGPEFFYTGPIYIVDSNPYKCDLAKFSDAYSFSVNAGYWLLDDVFYYETICEKINHDNGSMDIIFRMKRSNYGDVNGDGAFKISDIVLMQKYLLGDEVEFANSVAADFDMNNHVDSFDLAAMKNTLIKSMFIN